MGQWWMMVDDGNRKRMDESERGAEKCRVESLLMVSWRWKWSEVQVKAEG
jgi:hypothetical protein